MRFARPLILYLLFIPPILYFTLFITERRKLKDLERLGKLATMSRFFSRDLAASARRENIFSALAVFFFIIALAGPQAGTRLEPVKISGSDIHIALDLSKSMRAEDVKPSRFERARIGALELVKSLKGDRVGLILFAGDAFVQCPLTTDYDAVTTFINSLDAQTAVAAGTSVYAPLASALKFVKPEEDRYTILLLMTDGENTVEGHERVIRDLQKRSIKVFTIGIGTKEGSPIPVFDEEGKRTGYLKDANGTVVISMLHDEVLKEISEKTNGYYFEAGARMNEISRFLATVSSQKKRELETKRYTVYEERYQMPLAVGIIFLLLYILSTLIVKKEAA